MRRPWKMRRMILLPMCALAIAATASVAIAATSGNGGNDRKGRDSHRLRLAIPPPGEHLSALADKLGVSTSRLRDALDATRGDRPPRPPADRQEMEQRCKDKTDALGSKLGKSGDEVRAAFKAVIKDDIEAAVDAGRLTRARADRILERINAAECLPPLFGHHGFRGPCGPPGRMVAPDRSRGNGDAGFVEPAPAPAPPVSDMPGGAI